MKSIMNGNREHLGRFFEDRLKDISCRKAFVIRGELLDFLAITYTDGKGDPNGLAWVKYPNKMVQVFRTRKESESAMESKLEKMSQAIADFYGYELQDLDLDILGDDQTLKRCLLSQLDKDVIRMN